MRPLYRSRRRTLWGRVGVASVPTVRSERAPPHSPAAGSGLPEFADGQGGWAGRSGAAGAVRGRSRPVVIQVNRFGAGPRRVRPRDGRTPAVAQSPAGAGAAREGANAAVR